MKTKFNKRLVLNKVTLANLERSEMTQAKGGFDIPIPPSVTLFYTNCVECNQYSEEIPCVPTWESQAIPCDYTEGWDCQ